MILFHLQLLIWDVTSEKIARKTISQCAIMCSSGKRTCQHHVLSYLLMIMRVVSLTPSCHRVETLTLYVDSNSGLRKQLSTYLNISMSKCLSLFFSFFLFYTEHFVLYINPRHWSMTEKHALASPALNLLKWQTLSINH